jgi:hypothetical protein
LKRGIPNQISLKRRRIMPNITLGTLGGIPGVNQAAMTQPAGSDMCGAYALVAAVGAHGVFPVAANLAYNDAGPQPVNLNAAINVADNYHQLSAAVYSITGILNNAPPGPAGAVVPELIAAGGVYNSPAAMAQVARDLNRTVQINALAPGFAFLNALYPGAQARCTAVVGAANVNTAAGAYAPPGAAATQLVCVSTAPLGTGVGLHWLARGSDGNFYDPANGTIANPWVAAAAPMALNTPVGPYFFTGLWMEIT